MKCPKCGYVGFEDVERCRHCGYEFSLSPPAEEPDLPIKDDQAADLDGLALPDIPLTASGSGAELPLFGY